MITAHKLLPPYNQPGFIISSNIMFGFNARPNDEIAHISEDSHFLRVLIHVNDVINNQIKITLRISGFGEKIEEVSFRTLVDNDAKQKDRQYASYPNASYPNIKSDLDREMQKMYEKHGLGNFTERNYIDARDKNLIVDRIHINNLPLMDHVNLNHL